MLIYFQKEDQKIDQLWHLVPLLNTKGNMYKMVMQ